MSGRSADDGAPGVPGRVVVGIDGSVGSREAALFAARSARRRGDLLQAVVAVEPPPPREGWSFAAAAGFPLAPVAEVADRTRRMAAGMLDDVLGQVRREDGDVPEVDLVAVLGAPAEALHDAGRDADELVVGHRGFGVVPSVLLGSVGMATVLHAPCPVTVVPPREAATGREDGPVVVGVDGSEGSHVALVYALGEAARRATSVTVVVAHAAETATWPEAADLLPLPQDVARAEVDLARAFVEGTVAGFGGPVPPVEVIGAVGSPTSALADASRDAALLVVGHRGRGAIRSTLLGSTGLGAVLHASCPVTVVPSTGEVSGEQVDRPSTAGAR